MKKYHNIPGQHIGAISLQYAKRKPTRFYTTGIPALDEYTGGIPSGEMTLVAGRPGDGKTALVMQIMEHIATYHREPTGFFSVEMNGPSLVTRMVVSRTGLPSVALRKGELTQKQIKIRDKALLDISKLPIFIEDTSVLTIPLMERTARAWIKAGIRFLGLDYLQLMAAGRGGTMDTRAGFVGDCARSIKRIAKEEDVPFIVLAQLNRENVKGKRKPTSADLKESGDIEQIADNIALIHPDRDNPPVVDLILDKWRNGPKGVVSVHFDSARTRFESIQEEE